MPAIRGVAKYGAVTVAGRFVPCVPARYHTTNVTYTLLMKASHRAAWLGLLLFEMLYRQKEQKGGARFMPSASSNIADGQA